LRVCYFGTYKPDYPRNRIVIDGLREAGVEVVECNVPLWGSTEERISLASGKWLSLAFLYKFALAYITLIRKELSVPEYDVMLVGYPGQLDMYLARLLTWRRRRVLVFDVLMSLHQIFVERQLNQVSPTITRLVYWVEWGACRIADGIILDTESHREYFCQKYNLSPEKFRLVPLGADERVCYPLERTASASQTFRVVYHGQFVPLHGVEHIIHAARLLVDYPEIQFELIGEGATKSLAEDMVKEYGLPNVSFAGWVNKDELAQRLALADVCLGVFGTTQQALCTVPNKIWEGLAARKPVITGNTPAVRELLTHGQHLYLCEPGNPESLAEAILTLYNDPSLRERLARQGYAYLRDRFSMRNTGLEMFRHLAEFARRSPRSSVSAGDG
jgi:glycosyltransferase involved in cell wall biosynthesis